MNRQTALLVALLCYRLFIIDGVQCTRSLSKEENSHMESQLELSNKSSFKNLQILFEPFYDKASGKESSKIIKSSRIVSKVKMSSIGGVGEKNFMATPNLMREKHILDSKQMKTTNRPHTYLAIARTKVGPTKYAGGGGYLSLHNPKVVGEQFSTTRIRLQAGSDSIEAGWRVDIALYGDSNTHLFVRTDAGQSHCFNNRCPGYIHTDPDIPIDCYFGDVSKPGGPIYDLVVFITRDNKTGNWNLVVGRDFKVIGHWPPNIFKTSLVDRVEWGGAVYSPLGTPLPPMGSSNLPIGNPEFDGYIRRVQVLNEWGKAVDANYLETYADNSKLYSVIDKGDIGQDFDHLVLYGGPGHRA